MKVKKIIVALLLVAAATASLNAQEKYQLVIKPAKTVKQVKETTQTSVLDITAMGEQMKMMTITQSNDDLQIKPMQGSTFELVSVSTLIRNTQDASAMGKGVTITSSDGPETSQNKYLKALINHPTKFVLDSRGRVLQPVDITSSYKAVKKIVPAITAKAMADVLESPTIIFPADPIAVGETWTVSDDEGFDIVCDGKTIHHDGNKDVTYTLKEYNGKTFVITYDKKIKKDFQGIPLRGTVSSELTFDAGTGLLLMSKGKNEAEGNAQGASFKTTGGSSCKVTNK